MSDKSFPEPPEKPGISVKSIPFKPHKKGDHPKLKSRVSNFHITLNTNIRIDDDLTEESPLIRILQSTTNEVFGEEGHFVNFVQFPKGGAWNTANIVDLSVLSGVEVGSDDAHGARLHVHVQFKVRHHSYLRLDGEKIKTEMNMMLTRNGYPHKIAYVHITVHKPELVDYIGK
jgi:hypothetical protein